MITVPEVNHSVQGQDIAETAVSGDDVPVLRVASVRCLSTGDQSNITDRHSETLILK